MPAEETPAGAGKEAAAEKSAAKAATSEAIAEVAAGAEEQPGPLAPLPGQEPAPTAEPEAEGPPDAEAQPEPAKPTEEQPEPAPKEPLREEDVPTEYMGVDLSGLPAETRQEIIGRFTGKDRYIDTLHERMAERRKADGEAPAEQPIEEPAPVSDEDLVRAFGLDPEDPMFEATKDTMLPMMRRIVDMSTTVEQVAQRQLLADTVEQWNADIDSLADEFGALPEDVSHDDVLDFAVRNSITSPAEAYIRVVGSARQEVQTAAAEAKKAAQEVLTAKKREATTTRPRTTADVADKPRKGLKVRDAVAQAAREAESELGVSWAEAVRAEQS
jgi:hypothetical protein